MGPYQVFYNSKFNWTAKSFETNNVIITRVLSTKFKKSTLPEKSLMQILLQREKDWTNKRDDIQRRLIVLYKIPVILNVCTIFHTCNGSWKITDMNLTEWNKPSKWIYDPRLWGKKKKFSSKIRLYIYTWAVLGLIQRQNSIYILE